MKIKYLLLQGLILSILLILFSAGSAYARFSCVEVLQATPQKILGEVKQWMHSELDRYVPAIHQKRVVWAGDPGRPTDIMVYGVHGLYNSPHALSSLEPVFGLNRMNMMMSRLEGHYESNNLLRYNIKWRAWLEQTDREFRLARKMGKKILLVGHSTGALMVTWLALRYPEDVAGLVLFAPAFGVHPLSQIGAWILDVFDVSLHQKDGRMVYGHAGREVKKAAKAFSRWVDTQTKKDPRYLADRLKSIPIWMANTRVDVVINKSRAREFMLNISQDNPLGSVREDIWIPFSKLVLHDNITRPSNPLLPVFQLSLNEFISSLPRESDRVD